eukprot:3786324-Pyramimonas_sp.AAC.1
MCCVTALQRYCQGYCATVRVSARAAAPPGRMPPARTPRGPAPMPPAPARESHRTAPTAAH